MYIVAPAVRLPSDDVIDLMGVVFPVATIVGGYARWMMMDNQPFPEDIDVIPHNSYQRVCVRLLEAYDPVLRIREVWNSDFAVTYEIEQTHIDGLPIKVQVLKKRSGTPVQYMSRFKLTVEQFALTSPHIGITTTRSVHDARHGIIDTVSRAFNGWTPQEFDDITVRIDKYRKKVRFDQSYFEIDANLNHFLCNNLDKERYAEVATTEKPKRKRRQY